MAISSSVLSGPTHVMALGHPFAGSTPDRPTAVPIGIDPETKQVYALDPWKLKDIGILSAIFGMFLGNIGMGKSTAMKIFVLRLMMITAGFNMMRVVLNDYKSESNSSEYGPIAKVMGSKIFRIGESKVNPFEPRLFQTGEGKVYEFGILSVAEAMCEFSLGGKLIGMQSEALRIAVYTMLRYHESFWSPHLLQKQLRCITSTDIDDYYRNLDSKLNKMLEARIARISKPLQHAMADRDRRMFIDTKDNTSVADLKIAGEFVATLLTRVLTGANGEMFGDDISLYDMLTQRVVTKDWRGLTPESETLMRIIDNNIRISAVENNRLDLLPHLEVDDEKHRPMDNIVYARSNAFAGEISRGTHTCNISASHRFASMRKGGVGSELYGLANTIISNLGWVFIGKQNDDAATLAEYRERYHLSTSDMNLLPQLPKYTFATVLGESPMQLCRTFVLPAEQALIETDSATDRMNTRPNVMNPVDLQRFADTNGIRYLGEDAA